MRNYFINYFILLILPLIFVGCGKNIDKQGLVLQISEYQLSQSFQKSFPFEKDFLFGSLELKNPKIKMHKEKNRVYAKVNLGLKTLFTNPITGSFSISAEPKFKKDESAIYLHSVKLEDFDFGRLKMSEEFSKTFRIAVEPMINEIFNKYPIYKIPEDSTLGSFVQNVKIDNSTLLITYGI